MPDGTTLREFTIIAEDDQIMEVSPGIFFNVWTYNGTVPGPTIRATEGDIVRINFINNGAKSHTMHFHGIHPAEMDGVFEIVGPGGDNLPMNLRQDQLVFTHITAMLCLLKNTLYVVCMVFS